MVLFKIMELFRQQLIITLKTFDASIVNSFLNHRSLWDIGYDSENLTFIDIIKGVVPTFLSEKLFQFTNNRKLVLDILLKFYDALYEDIKKFIWNVRCDTMIIKEQSYNINKKEKRKKCNNRDSISIPSSSSSSIHHGFGNYGLDLEIKLGTNWLGFTTMLNHWSIMRVIVSLGLFFINFLLIFIFIFMF